MHIGVGVKGFGGWNYGVVIAESSRGSDRGYHSKLANVPVFASQSDKIKLQSMMRTNLRDWC